MLDHQWKHLSNEELLQEYQRAQAPAFEELFERTKSLVYNYLLAKLRNTAEAEEAFQKTFFRVHRYVASYDRTQSALGWILGIARNVAADTAKQFSQANQAVYDAPESCTDSGMSTLEAREVIRALVETLSEEERRLLEKRFLEDFSYEEIAQADGISVDGVRQRVSRLLKGLRSSFCAQVPSSPVYKR